MDESDIQTSKYRLTNLNVSAELEFSVMLCHREIDMMEYTIVTISEKHMDIFTYKYLVRWKVDQKTCRGIYLKVD